MGMARKDVIRDIAMKIADLIDEGTVPWRQPWRNGDLPCNAQSGKAYRGINLLALAMSAQVSGYSDPRWCTLKQANARGGRVRAGSKGTPIVFWKTLLVERDEQVRRVPLARGYVVFNAEQIDGAEFEPLPERQLVEPIVAAQKIVNEYLARGPSISYGHELAAYSPSSDHVLMPTMCDFVSAERFHATLFHELGHSTGHQSRLGRDMSGMMGDHSYSREELVAEYTASFLCGLCGIATEDVVEQSASYLKGWSSKIRDDPGMFSRACAEAQRAVDLILGSEVEA